MPIMCIMKDTYEDFQHMNQIGWYQEFQKEIEQAQAARMAGNEGMARVCARRAVGVIIGEYYRRNRVDLSKMGAYDRLNYLINQEVTSPEIRNVVAHFVQRVSPERDLPIQVDLIIEARWLLTALLPNSQ